MTMVESASSVFFPLALTFGGPRYLQHNWKMVSGRPSISDFVWISSHMELFSVPV